MNTHQYRAQLANAWRELQSNRRLQIGLVAVLAMLIFEGALRWNDRLAAERQELVRTQRDLVTLRNQTRDEASLRKLLTEMETVRQVAESRLWTVPSEAVGQARLKEWLTDAAKRSGIQDSFLSLASPRSLSGIEGGDQSAGTPVKDADALREFRASIRTGFTPESLEKLLAEIEAGEVMASVESLTVNKRERRVEISVRVLMRLGSPLMAGGV